MDGALAPWTVASLSVCFSVACNAPSPEPSAFGAAYFTLTEKGAVSTYLNRLATPEHQLVATLEPISRLDSRLVTPRMGEHLVLVELNAPEEAPLPGERARFDTIAVLSLPRAEPSPAWLDGERYAEALSDVEHTTAASRSLADAAVLSLSPRAEVRGEAGRPSSRIAVDRASLEQKLAELSGAAPITVAGRRVTLRERGSAEGRARVRAWLAQVWGRLGYETEEAPYSSPRGNGRNFVATRVGADPSRRLLLSAHIDSVGNAGADDDAAGIVTALGVAQALERVPLHHTLSFVGFDQEENGLVGSTAYTRELGLGDDFRGFMGDIHLEMTGYDSDGDGAFHAIDCNENVSSELTNIVLATLRRGGMPLTPVAACTNRSDHAAFWRHDQPAIVISENFFGGDGNPCYHRSCDQIDRINFDYMERLTRVVAEAVAELVGGV